MSNQVKFFFLTLILFLITIFMPVLSFAQSSKFYQITLNYDKGSFTLKDTVVFPGEISKATQEGAYKVELLSFSNTSLYTSNFDIATSIHGEEFDYTTGKVTSQTITVENTDVVINIPYFPNGKEINVYDLESKKVLTFSVEHFSEITPTQAQVSKPAETAIKDKSLLWISAVLMFIPVVLGLVFYIRHRKSQKNPPNPTQNQLQ